MFLRSITLILALVGIFACSTRQPDEHDPQSSLADLKVYDGLEVTLFASEPMFSNPTNMDIDAQGRVWITEAYNYRNQLNPKNPVREKGDRIMVLEDTDGDGKADNSKVFYQGTDVNAALGICVLGNKIIVSCSPNVFVFTDANNNLQFDPGTDKKEIMYQGIEGVQHDHAIHAFNFAHDGRLYFNMGNEGSVLVDAKGDTVIDIHGRKIVTNGKPFRDGLALRSNLDGSDVEVLGHNFRNNYELTVDPYGTIWQSDNDDDGNKGTRINYVMEFGNYGFKDEMTGASWPQRRTNMEKEIPLRHWHLNDPGVVPNLLQTGSGSPTGITMYEGTMLPEAFRGQIIHAEPGHNVIRSYPVENDGAGYKATIVNILEAQKDQWFRPADVTVAPDGSLFVVDWYDPGVGGHQVGDLDRGRVYRIATPDAPYEIKPMDVSSESGAMEALFNPNPATRYLGWTALAQMGEAAETGLKSVWHSESSSDNPRERAQAFWLLIRLPSADMYIEEALNDNDPNIRIMGIRGLRLLKKPILPTIARLAEDTSPQVRREVAIALRGIGTKEAASVWTRLANQYDGKDRWYLEALGISADGNWDLYFNAWLKDVGKEWNTPARRDIVWRSRSKNAIPLLAELIRASDDQQMLRYFRAFDFHTDPSRQEVLSKLVTQVTGDKVLYSLKHMKPEKTSLTPPVKAALDRTLDQYKNKIEFVELANSFRLKERSSDLLELILTYPDSLAGREAAKTLLYWDETERMSDVLKGEDASRAVAMTKALDPLMWNPKVIAMMEETFMDTTRDIEVRKLAVRTFGGPWESEDRLLALAKEKKIPADLETTAAGVFQTMWRVSMRDEAAKYLTLPGNKEGKPLPPVSVLIERKGDPSKGQAAFASVCANCHTVKGEGVNFGPDLSEIGSKLSREAMYTSILYPDQGISFGYEGYMLKLRDGSSAFGRIVSETADKIEMQYMDAPQTVNKADVVSRTKLPNSLMPSNLQSQLTEEELVDLVEYLMELKGRSVASN
jgi:putative membrane-bound dehydrogenase-like protein